MAFSPEVDAVLDQVPLRAFSGETEGVLDQLTVRWFSLENDAELEQVPLHAFTLEVDADLAILVAVLGPLISGEPVAMDTLPPPSATGPMLAEVFVAPIPPPTSSTGPMVGGDIYAVFVPTPPLPPIPSPPSPPRRVRSRGRVSAVKPLPLVLGRYTGPAFPFGAEPGNALGPKDDVAVIYTSIVNILTTPKGTVPYDPKMGSQVPGLVFEPNDEVTRNLIRYFSYKDLSEQEPRILVYAVFTEQPDDHSVVVTVGFQIVGDPTAKQYNAPALFKREV